MKHRHLTTSEWTLATIDSVLEYGDLPDWRELFAAASSNQEVAKNILKIAETHYVEGSSALAKTLVQQLWPDLFSQ